MTLRTLGARCQPPRLAGHQGVGHNPCAWKQVYLPLFSREGPINILTGSHAGAATNTPAYKETAVKIKVLSDQGTNPLKPLNFGYSGKPTPQSGVEVERKWKGADYHMPGTNGLVQIQSQQ